MSRRRFDEAGESLAEIAIAIVLIGIISSAFLTAVMTSTSASKAHREAVTADAMLRNYAEAAKQAVRDMPCNSGNVGQSFSGSISYTPPSGWSPPVATGLTCPAANAVQLVHISVTTPIGIVKTLDVEVRMK